MMRLGLLGFDRSIGWLLETARARGHVLGPVCDVDAADLGGLPGVVATSWETLLDAGSCDAVLVGGGGWNPRRAEAVRALVQAGRTLVLSHPLDLSMVWAYELEMIRADSGARLIPFLPDRRHPLVARCQRTLEAALAGGGAIGAPETILLERCGTVRDRAAVLAAFARDADLIRVIAGSPGRLSTLGGGSGMPDDDDVTWGTLAVGLSGPTSVPVRWQMERGPSPGLRLRLRGDRGETTLELPDGDRVTCTLTTADGEERVPLDRGAAILAELERVGAADTPVHGADPAPSVAPAATWDDAARTIELAETVPRSLARGRGIDLHQEEFTDLGTFKGTMASVGCGLVLLGLVVLLLATLVGGIAREAGWEWAGRLAGAWPVAVLVILSGFLALQLLPVIVGAAPQRKR